MEIQIPQRTLAVCGCDRTAVQHKPVPKDVQNSYFAGSAASNGRVFKDDDDDGDDDDNYCNGESDGTRTHQQNIDNAGHHDSHHPHHYQQQQQQHPETFLNARHTAADPLSRTQHFFNPASGSSNNCQPNLAHQFLFLVFPLFSVFGPARSWLSISFSPHINSSLSYRVAKSRATRADTSWTAHNEISDQRTFFSRAISDQFRVSFAMSTLSLT